MPAAPAKKRPPEKPHFLSRNPEKCIRVQKAVVTWLALISTLYFTLKNTLRTTIVMEPVTRYCDGLLLALIYKQFLDTLPPNLELKNSEIAGESFAISESY